MRAIVPRTPSSGASTGSPSASGATASSGSWKAWSASSTRAARADAAPSRRSRSRAAGEAGRAAARLRSSSRRRASRISSRSPRSSARAPSSSRSAAASACRRSCAAEARTVSISARSSASRACACDQRPLGFQPPGARLLELVAGSALGRLGLGEQLLGPSPRRLDERARSGDELRVEPEPLGDLERPRRAGPADRDPVQRRVRLRVEAGRRVRGALGRARPLLQLGEVRRHHRQPGLRGEALDERLRERRALLGIGAGGELVEEDERAPARSGEDRDDRAQMAGEGGEAHLDRLPVADVGEHAVEHRQRRLRRRRAQAGLVEERREPERLERDRLAARVRPADDEGAQPVEVEVDGNRGRTVEQRVARREQAHLAADRHFGAAPAARERPARECEVDCTERLDEGRERTGLLRDYGGERAEDPLRLVTLGAGRLGQAVVPLDDREGLDEERLARAGGVVDDAGHARPGRGPHGEHRPAAAPGDEPLLEVLRELGRAGEPRQLLRDTAAAGAELRAEPPEQGGGVVAQVGAVVLDATADRVAQTGEARVDPGGTPLEQGEVRGHRLERPPGGEARVDRARDGAEVRGLQHPAARGAFDGRPDVGGPCELRFGGLVEQRDRLGGRGLAPRDLGCVRRGHERLRQRSAHRRPGRRREALHDRRVLEDRESVGVHGTESRPLCAEAYGRATASRPRGERIRSRSAPVPTSVTSTPSSRSTKST